MKTQNKMRAIHPGEILKEEFLAYMDLSANALAQKLQVPTNRITQILNMDRGITGDTALRLSAFFGTTPEFWMNLQAAYDLKMTELSAATLSAIQKENRNIKKDSLSE